MLENITQWFIESTYIELLGYLVLSGIVLGFTYSTYEVLKFLVNMYIHKKLVELYQQKDRLWGAYDDLYDNYEDLKEKTWDYDDTKKEVKRLSKQLSELEDLVLESYVSDSDEENRVISGDIEELVKWGNNLNKENIK